MSRVQFPCLWFDGNAEEAAEFYVGLLPDSRITKVWRTPAETPAGPEGTVLTVDFTVGGQQFQGLNGGSDFTFNEAVSFVIECDDQAEVDRLWAALTADGGEPGPCGWLKDRFGLGWQVIPRRLNELLDDPDPGRARSGHGSDAQDAQDRRPRTRARCRRRLIAARRGSPCASVALSTPGPRNRTGLPRPRTYTRALVGVRRGGRGWDA